MSVNQLASFLQSTFNIAILHPPSPSSSLSLPQITSNPTHWSLVSLLSPILPLEDCPICLSPATAPRVVKCGHYFCYLCLAQVQTGVCPVCAGMISSGKPVYRRQVSCDPPESAASHDPPESSSMGSASSKRDLPESSSVGSASSKLVLLRRHTQGNTALPVHPHWTDAALRLLSTRQPFDFEPFAPECAPVFKVPRQTMQLILERDLADVIAFIEAQGSEQDLFWAAKEKLVVELRAFRHESKLVEDSLAGKNSKSEENRMKQRSARISFRQQQMEARKVHVLAKGVNQSDHHQSHAFNFLSSDLDTSSPSDHIPPPVLAEPPLSPLEQTLMPPLPPSPTASGSGRSTPALKSPLSQVPSQSSSPVFSDPTSALISPSPSSASAYKNPPLDIHSFYRVQGAPNRHTFLHPIDHKILLTHFQTLGQDLPAQLDLARDPSFASDHQFVLTEVTRKRYKYLDHLPLGTHISFVHYQLSSIVPATTMEPFQSAMQAHKSKIDQKVKQEAAEQRKQNRRKNNRKGHPNTSDDSDDQLQFAYSKQQHHQYNQHITTRPSRHQRQRAAPSSNQPVDREEDDLQRAIRISLQDYASGPPPAAPLSSDHNIFPTPRSQNNTPISSPVPASVLSPISLASSPLATNAPRGAWGRQAPPPLPTTHPDPNETEHMAQNEAWAQFSAAAASSTPPATPSTPDVETGIGSSISKRKKKTGIKLVLAGGGPR